MHVLLVVQNNSFPTDKRVAKEARSLREAGYAVSAISPAFGNDQTRRDHWDGINVYRYRHFESTGGMAGFVLEYANALLRIFFIALGLYIRKPFKSIHVANPPDFFWPMALFFKLFRVRFIFDQHDISAEMYRINEQAGQNAIYRFLNWNEGMTVRCANGVVTTNESIRERLVARHGLGNKPCAVVYNGPAVEFRARPDAELEAHYADKKVILYIGEIARMDSVDVVVQAAREMAQNRGRTDCIFVLLGDGPDRARLERQVTEHGLTDFVEFKGMVAHDVVMKYLHVAEVCLVPDEPNGLNEFLTLIKTLEYMKAEKPFVAFDLKETKVIAGESARFARDMEDFVDQLMWLLEHPAEAKAMGQAGRERVEHGYLWPAQAEKLVGLYREILA